MNFMKTIYLGECVKILNKYHNIYMAGQHSTVARFIKIFFFFREKKIHRERLPNRKECIASFEIKRKKKKN